MKTAELYAGLDWGKVEILIPQQAITDASLGEVQDSSPISIDEAVGKAFHESLARKEGNGDFQSVLTISGRRYRTALMPKSIRIESTEAELPSCRILQESFSRHGLLLVRFAEDRIQYTVDLERFTAGDSI